MNIKASYIHDLQETPCRILAFVPSEQYDTRIGQANTKAIICLLDTYQLREVGLHKLVIAKGELGARHNSSG